MSNECINVARYFLGAQNIANIKEMNTNIYLRNTELPMMQLT